MKIKDKNITHGLGRLHPDFEPFLIFNKGDTFHLVSFYDTDPEAIRLRTNYPHLYPAKELFPQIKVPRGSHARLPHSKYRIVTHDGKPATIQIRPIDKL